MKRLAREPTFLKRSLPAHFCITQQKAPYNVSAPYNSIETSWSVLREKIYQILKYSFYKWASAGLRLVKKGV